MKDSCRVRRQLAINGPHHPVFSRGHLGEPPRPGVCTCASAVSWTAVSHARRGVHREPAPERPEG
jgi:hypothetical protein